MGAVRGFGSAFISTWTSLMSGGVSLGMALIAGLSGSPHQALWWAAAYVSAVLAAFFTWRAEWIEPGPQVTMTYESDYKQQPGDMPFREYKEMRDARDSSGLQVGNMPIILKNLSDVPALNVHVKDITVNGKLASFEPVPVIEKGTPVSIKPMIPELGPMFCRDFHRFLAGEDQPVDVPITIGYHDFDCKRFYETGCEIHMDRWVFSTRVKSYGRVAGAKRKRLTIRWS